MSIWRSVDEPPPGEIPPRDNYTGADLPGRGGDIDLATATSWHDLIRLSVIEPAPSPVTGQRTEATILLTREEARQLLDRLIAARNAARMT